MKEQLHVVEKEKSTDYLLRQIKGLGVGHVFGMTGGAISNQIDAFSRVPINFVSVQHEQAAAMMVEAYSKLKGYGVAMATSGPGGTNLITGMYGCWHDSTPSLFITGQVSTFDMRKNDVRQRGFQEIDMVSTMRPFTKYTSLVERAEDLPLKLHEAVTASLSGRGGPVHLDIPMDVQQSCGDFKDISRPERRKGVIDVSRVNELISKAERPVLIVGNGVRMSGAENEIIKLADMLGWPILPSWGCADFLHENRIGLFGVYGERGANYTVQNSDLILSIGCRLDTRMTGSNPKQFAREAKKIIVDIDRNELEKGVVTADLPIEADAGDFITSLINSDPDTRDVSEWREKCKEWGRRYPNVRAEHFEGEKISPYAFSRILSDEAKEGSIIIPDCGGNMAWMYQAFEPKRGQRIFTSMGNSPMGYSFPAAIGAYFATEGSGRDVICTIGDGGMQINIQELQTVKNYGVPVKIFVFQNKGYGIIRQFQDLYMGGRHVATQEGVPDFAKVARAYGIASMTINAPKDVRKGVRAALACKEAILVNVMMDEDSVILPRAIFGKPIEEQHPFLPDDEVEKNLLVKRWKP